MKRNLSCRPLGCFHLLEKHRGVYKDNVYELENNYIMYYMEHSIIACKQRASDEMMALMSR